MPFLRILALSLLVALVVPAVAAADSADLRRKISVVGQSSTLVANDAARLNLGVRATRPTARTALQAASRRMQAVIGAARAAGITEPDIRTDAISVSRLVTRLKRGRTRFRGYRATQSISVVARDVAAIGGLVDRAVAAGTTQVAGPEFFVADTARSYRDGLALAFDDARAKAQVLAERAGVTLGPVLSIHEGANSDPAASSAVGGPASAEAAAPATPTQPGQSSLDVTVSVVFAVA